MVRLISCSLGQLSLNGPTDYRLSRPKGGTPVGQTVFPQSPFGGLRMKSIHLRAEVESILRHCWHGEIEIPRDLD